VERIGTTATVWLGTTLACAQCHNHKYDPFSQKDFYALLAFFENTAYRIEGERHDRRLHEPTLDIATAEQQQHRAELEREIELAKAAMNRAAPASREGSPPRPLGDLLAELSEVNKSYPVALVMQDRAPPVPAVTRLRVRGSFLSPAEEVAAATPAALHALPQGAARNRLTLARWLIDDKNPLVARVAVNRAWAQFFGRGLVETIEDFGRRGARPSHPELLDWLAVEFQESGWKLKRLHKLIVMSAAYRQRSAASAESWRADPNNVLLGRGPRFRMSAEGIRDTTLAVSGLLNPQRGGPSVFPPQPQMTTVTDHGDMAWNESGGSQRYRRGLYTFWRRTQPYPAMALFDAPTREVCTVNRTRSNTPLQALALLNDRTAVDAAAALAAKIETEGGSELREKATYGFRLCTGRRPNDEELRLLTAAYERLAGEESPSSVPSETQHGGPSRAWLLIAQSLLNLDETLTKE
jgi:hypothetical protein